MNVTEETLREYAETFHRTLEQVSGQFFSPEQANGLLHKSLLPARITCYVSTQLGLAFEYWRQNSTVFETVRGSQRIEDLVVGAPRPLQGVGPLFRIGGQHITIGNSTLADAFPFRLDSTDADVTFYDVRFECSALNWSREVEYLEVFADRNAARWTLDAAKARAKDEVLAALLLERCAKSKGIQLHEAISVFQEKTILVLGAYDSDGIQRLSRIFDSLVGKGYEPLLIKDVPDFEHYDLAQKVTAVGSLCRFVVVDDSTQSGHLSEFEICRNHRWLTVVLRGGDPASWMTAGASVASNVILELEYDPAEPQVAVDKGIEWAEGRLTELKTRFNMIYPWRSEK